jgi:molybdopterin-guanine dinucleotide biosynthesis protein A
MTRVGGIVLCGGASSRMGRPKAWLPVGGEFMLQRVVRVMRDAVQPMIVVAAPGQNVPLVPPEVTIIRDDMEGRGPLQGLVTGLQALEGKAEAAFLAACDMPFLTTSFVRSVVGALRAEWAIVPRVAGRLHPLAAAYSLAALPTLVSELAADRVRMTDLFAHLPTRFLEEDELRIADSGLRSLFNINTPDEYAWALSELQSDEPRRSLS